METLGNIDLLNRHKIGFLAGSKTLALSVLPTYDWAKEIASRENLSIISGFQSPLEKDVLDFLLKGKCGIIYVMAKRLYKKIPMKFKQSLDEGRLLFISISKDNVLRAGKAQNIARTNYIAEICDELIISSLIRSSSLHELKDISKRLTII